MVRLARFVGQLHNRGTRPTTPRAPAKHAQHRPSEELIQNANETLEPTMDKVRSIAEANFEISPKWTRA
jgi:hypothetical protein